MRKEFIGSRLADLLLLTSIAAFFCGSASAADSPTLTTGDQFERLPLPRVLKPYALGVADVDDDGWLDIFTTNHWARPLVLVNDRKGGFVDRVLELNLGTDQRHWSADPTLSEDGPPLGQPGVYLYWQGTELVVRAHQLPETMPVSGVVLMKDPYPVVVIGRARAEAGKVADLLAENAPDLRGDWRSAIAFTVQGDDVVRFGSTPWWAPSLTAPVTVLIGAGLPLDLLFVGDRAVSPEGRTVRLSPDDRHAMAWFDWDGDGQTDVLAVNGAEQGRTDGKMQRGRGGYRLLRRQGERFQQVDTGDDLELFGCSSRDTSLVDVNGDGRLDLYQVCGRVNKRPNQLFEQDGSGHFHESAARYGLDLPGEGRIAWLDVDGDGDLDLVWAPRSGITLYRNDGGRFTSEIIVAEDRQVAQLATGDFDHDGDIDLFAGSARGSRLFVNRDGRLVAQDPASIGLPKQALCATWVDFDNDGRLDLHVLPGGLYAQNADGSFSALGILAIDELPERPFCRWADFDNDGFPDLAVSIQEPAGLLAEANDWVGSQGIVRSLQTYFDRYPFVRRGVSDLSVYRNRGNGNDWLQLRLVGPAGNEPAIGARVRLTTGGRTTTLQVGHLNGGLESYGNYRVYFGLGPDAAVPSVDIDWPDGTHQTLDQVSKNQLLNVRQGSPQTAHRSGTVGDLHLRLDDHLAVDPTLIEEAHGGGGTF